MSVEAVTESLRARAPEFAGLNARVLFDLGEAGSLLVDATATPPALSNEAGEADCTIKLSLEDMQKLLAGQLNPTFAYTMGKLKIEGSMGLAMKLAAMLDE